MDDPTDKSGRRLLILGGTAEAAALARRIADECPGALDVTTSLAGRTAPPQHRLQSLPGRTRVGGFGGTGGLAAWLADHRIDLVIDATHPFAAAISAHAAMACARAGIPRLMLIRPAWTPQPGDRWCEAATAEDAAALLPGLGQRVFLATGSGGLDAFARLTGLWFLVRMVTPPAQPLPLPHHHLLLARPPFRREDEAALLTDHRIDVVVSKNSGGATEAKLAAARDLGLPVVMISRPPAEAGERVDSVDAALHWLSRPR